jgi:uncharacterized membrane protein
MNRHLKIIFTVSILLNVLLIGALAGSCSKRWDGRWDGPSHMARNGDPQFDHEMARVMQEARKNQKPLQDELKAAKKELHGILAAETFDEAAFNAASEKMYKVQGDLFRARNEATLKMAKDMSVEERREMAKRLQEMSARHDRMKERMQERHGRDLGAYKPEDKPVHSE